MHDLDLITTLAGCLVAALVCGLMTQRLGLSPLVGYLIAGLVVGPYTPGFVADRHLAEQLAEVGVILLMFGVGLQFHLDELLAVWRVALVGALGRSAVVALIGVAIGVGLGWGWAAGLVFGLALSVASTVVLLRVLADHGDLHTPAGHVAVGWLVVEDLFTVLVLVLLPAVFAPDAGPAAVAWAVVVALVKVGAMVGLTFLLGNRLIPWLMRRVAATRSRELFTLAVLALALGIAVGSVRLFGVTMALGAFLAGMVVGRTEFSLRAATEALPMRDAFAVLFFVSVGILFHPRELLAAPGAVALTLAVVVLVKAGVALAIVLAMKYPARVAASVALATAQIGEFSFILASAGERLKLLDDRARTALIGASIVSITLNPLLYRLVGPIEALLRRLLSPAPPTGLDPAPRAPGASTRRVIIVGHGPVGRTLARLLRRNRFEPAIIELNHETVGRLSQAGTAAVYGDAARGETLEHAGVGAAVALFLTSSRMDGAREAIRQARELHPKLLIFARTTYLREAPELRAAGADVVFSGEGEVALAMTEFLLRQLGASPDQIDREREHIRSDLFRGDPPPDSLPEDRPLSPPESDPPDPTERSEPPARPTLPPPLILLAACLLPALASCGPPPAAAPAPGAAKRTAVAAVDPPDPARIAAGQTLYVPAYSSIYTSDKGRPFPLAITLSIRNTDSARPIVVTSARYHDHDGRLVHAYAPPALRVGPLASVEFFVQESDTRGGISASFLVSWAAEQAVSPPVVEAVMVGTASTQGVSFTCPARVLSEVGPSQPAVGG